MGRKSERKKAVGCSTGARGAKKSPQPEIIAQPEPLESPSLASEPVAALPLPDPFLPEYSTTPVLRAIAAAAQATAPERLKWAMEQYSKHSGDIDALMRACLRGSDLVDTPAPMESSDGKSN